jgi:hypothetical protein
MNAPHASPVEARLWFLADTLSILLLKVSTKSNAALAVLHEGRGAALSDIQAARDEEAKI